MKGRIDMNKKFISICLMVVLLLGFIIQAGVTVYSNIGSQSNTQIAEQPTQELLIADTTDTEEQVVVTEVSQAIQDAIKQSDPVHFDKNMTNYKNLLVKYNVHSKFKNYIENLITQGYKLPEIMIAYEFLYHHYGTSTELSALVLQKQGGKSWSQIFLDFKNSHTVFIPRAFDTDYLEALMQNPGIHPDDIMIADRISHETAQKFEDLMHRKVEAESWKTINSTLNILNSAAYLPRVKVTTVEIGRYASGQAFPEQKVVEAFVLAQKLDVSPETIIAKLKAGLKEEKILEEFYEARYY
jgi:hypothetical protein